MGEYWLELLDYAVCAIELFWIGECLLHNRVRDWKRYVVAVFAFCAIVFLKRNQWLFAVTIFEVAMYIFLFQGKIIKKVIFFLEISLITGAIDILIEGILTLIPNELFRYNTISGEFISTLISAILLCGIVKQKWFQSFFQYLHILKWFQYIAILIITVSCISLLITSEIALGKLGNSKISVTFYGLSIILFGAIIGGIIWLVYGVYKTDYYFKQNQLKDEIIYAQQQYYQSIYENDKEMRRFRHDIRSQLGCLNLLLEEGETEQAVTYLKSIEDNFNKKILYKYRVGNEVLDAVINYIYSQVEPKDIVLDVRGKICNIGKTDIYDLCTIFSNAINNAVEACEKIQDVEKEITVSILEQEKTVFYRFENPATMEMYEVIKQSGTTKEDSKNHGFGIENIRRAVEKNGGVMEYLYQDGKLILEIYFEV